MDADDFRRIFPTWTVYAAGFLALGCVVIVALYYLEHPGRSILEDFDGRTFSDGLGLVGTPGDPTPDPGVEAGGDGEAVA